MRLVIEMVVRALTTRNVKWEEHKRHVAKPLAFVPAASCSSPPKRIVGLTRAESGIEVCMGYPYRGVAEYLGGPFSPTGEQLNHPMGGMAEEVTALEARVVEVALAVSLPGVAVDTMVAAMTAVEVMAV